MAAETIAELKKRSFFRKLLRGLGFMLIGVVVLVFWAWLLGGSGAVIGVIAMIGLFVEGYRGRSLSDIGASKPTILAPVGASSGGVVAATVPPRRRGWWWKAPLVAVGGLLALAVVAAIVAPDKPKDSVTNSGNGERAAAVAPPSKDTPAVENAKVEADPMGKYRSFQQRPCNGIEDCKFANIEAEQTPASRDFNSTARTSIAKAVMQLGAPTYVLRAGDVVGRPEYEGNPTEMRFADAIVGWNNGACAPNELHIMTRAGQTMVSPMPGGAYCAKDGSAYPMPGDKFACADGRKGDALCTMAGLQKLPGMADERAVRPPAADNDPVHNAGRHLGYLTWAARNCPGRISETFKAASAITRGRAAPRSASTLASRTVSPRCGGQQRSRTRRRRA